MNESEVLSVVDRIHANFFDRKFLTTLELDPKAIYLDLISIHNEELIYTASIESFIAGVFLACEYNYPFDVNWDSQFLNKVRRVCIKLRHKIHAEEELHNSQERQNADSLSNYINKIIYHHSKVLVVRVDLFYPKNIQERININVFHEDMKCFLECIANKRGFLKGSLGYAWALEQGYSKGYHCHLLFLFNGSKHCRDIHFGYKIGELWIHITKNRGAYFNCNTDEYKNKYENSGILGIGMINRNSKVEVENLFSTANYLTIQKFEQRLKVHIPGMRTFGHGIYKTSGRRRINR